MILTRRLFALSAASAVVAGGALVPATAYAAAPRPMAPGRMRRCSTPTT